MSLRHAAMMLLVLGTVGTATAQLAPTPPAAPGAAGAVIDPKVGLQLTPQQRSMIFQSVTREKDKVKTPPANINASVGAELPASLELYTVPDGVAAEVPNAKLYKYTIVDGQVVLVDPTNMKVVEVIRQ